MNKRIVALAFALSIAMLLVPPAADAQIRRIGRAARNAAEREVNRKVDTVVGDAVACAVGNRECVEEAQKNGDKVVIVDEDGEIITDESGHPIVDPALAEAQMEKPGSSCPGTCRSCSSTD